ncbi:hypothetical protein GYMLUDRAFT_259125 [Collybiopsis luxurians FD-317 M1]|uniref:Uncharacterized protein n=1 Tax=Collybiopsis luxurians FD-317 M1 TaxID=944289 RepID=A0A0D0CWB9_9AGAR|nr:hypothetical protein GYMLUDRAFT_259125 [Collybiopsis luxurians FD-317 M1]
MHTTARTDTLTRTEMHAPTHPRTAQPRTTPVPDAAALNEEDSIVGRAWGLWTAQVDTNSLYVNDLRP